MFTVGIVSTARTCDECVEREFVCKCVSSWCALRVLCVGGSGYSRWLQSRCWCLCVNWLRFKVYSDDFHQSLALVSLGVF